MKNFAKKLNWHKSNGLVPTIIQNAANGMVLMLGYMNKESLQKTIKTKKAWFYSRSKQRLWMKGETSKDFLIVKSIIPDCDNDVLLIQALPQGPTCHTRKISCFNIKQKFDNVLLDLYTLILNRKQKLPKGSYTAQLFQSGLKTICGKVVEEAIETVQAVKKESRQRVIEEIADLFYHMLVLLAANGISLMDIGRELARRKK